MLKHDQIKWNIKNLPCLLSNTQEENINIDDLLDLLIKKEINVRVCSLDGSFDSDQQGLVELRKSIMLKNDEIIPVMLIAPEGSAAVTLVGINPKNHDKTYFYEDPELKLMLELMDGDYKDAIIENSVPTKEFLVDLNIIADQREAMCLTMSVKEVMIESVVAGIRFIPGEGDEITTTDQVDSYINGLADDASIMLPLCIEAEGGLNVSCIGISTKNANDYTILLPYTVVTEFIGNDLAFTKNVQVTSTIDFFEQFAESIVRAPMIQG